MARFSRRGIYSFLRRRFLIARGRDDLDLIQRLKIAFVNLCGNLVACFYALQNIFLMDGVTHRHRIHPTRDFLMTHRSLACFLPHTILTESESECCKQMANECGEANMQLHECCARTVRTEIATAAKTVRRMLPQFEIVATAATFEQPGLQTSPDMPGIFDREIHAPPHDLPVPSLALRI